jgi:NAD(P)-dependent dehydrogenase (short-subunit alcohol dehydrogenase family)
MARVLITGCSSGFGFEAAMTFRSRGDEVFAGVRSLEGTAIDALRAVGVAPVIIDVTDEVSVERGVARILSGGAIVGPKRGEYENVLSRREREGPTRSVGG